MPSRKQVALVVSVVTLLMITGALLVLTASPAEDDSGRINVVATFYPLAYMAQELGGEKVKVSTLIPANAEVHSWSPSPSDILEANQAIIILYNGAGLEPWVERDLLPSLDLQGKIVVNTTEGIHLLPAGEEGEHSEEPEDGHEHGAHDPHTWISPYIARQQALNIYEALLAADPGNSTYFALRRDALLQRFDQMDSSYLTGLSDKERATVFVAHGAYGYLADRYGFQQRSVIGISGDEQPSPTTIAELVDLMVSSQTYFVYLDPVFSDQYVNTLKESVEEASGHPVTILKLYLMTGPLDGLDYFQQMQHNLDDLKLGLGAS